MKRILKYILTIVILIVIVFLGTGLFVKQVSYKVSTSVNLPIEDVFAKFNDKDKLNKWIPTIKEFKVLEEKNDVVGSTYLLKVSDHGKLFDMKERITHYELNKTLGLKFEIEGMNKYDFITFQYLNGKTVITNNAVCVGKSYFLKCLFPYFKSTLKQKDQEFLNNFKKFAES